MARKRFITSDISIDDKVAAVAEEDLTAALMWPWFCTNFDDWGRASANPREIRLNVFQAFTYNAQDIQRAIDLYHEQGLVLFYRVGDKPYMQANPEAFYKLNSYIQKSRQQHDGSKFPPPSDHLWGQHWLTSDWSEKLQKATKSADELQSVQYSVPSPSPSPSPMEENATPNHHNTKGARVGEDARRLATMLYDWLKKQNALPAAKGWFMKQAGFAENLLLGEYKFDEWIACLEWAMEDRYWSMHLSSLAQLGDTVWTQYARRTMPFTSASTAPFSELD